MKNGAKGLLQMGGSLVGCRRVVHEVDALRNIPFEALLGRLKQLLLVFAQLSEDVISLLGSGWLVWSADEASYRMHCMTYAELHRNGKKIDAGLFRDSVATRHSREVYESWFYNAFITLHGLDDSLGEATNDISRSSFFVPATLRLPEPCVSH